MLETVLGFSRGNRINKRIYICVCIYIFQIYAFIIGIGSCTMEPEKSQNLKLVSWGLRGTNGIVPDQMSAASGHRKSKCLSLNLGRK